MRIIFSRDRPAQLDLLLRSLERHAPDERTAIMARGTTPDFRYGYSIVGAEHYTTVINAGEDVTEDFDALLRELLARQVDTVTFLCDDDVLYAPVPDPASVLDDDRVLCVSWRLGLNNTQQAAPWPMAEGGELLKWHWASQEPHDFGYPGSIDGHTFRLRDVRRLLGDHPIQNPTVLETVLARRVELLAEERPLMACYPSQALVGIPVNRVSEDSGVANGQRYPQPTGELLRQFLGGQRIDLDAMRFDNVDACHVEMSYPWRQA